MSEDITEFFRRSWRWKKAVFEGSLIVFIGLGSIWCATVQSWDAQFVESLRWWNWTFIIVSMLVNACKDVLSFTNKTFHVEQERINKSVITP